MPLLLRLSATIMLLTTTRLTPLLLVRLWVSPVMYPRMVNSSMLWRREKLKLILLLSTLETSPPPTAMESSPPPTTMVSSPQPTAMVSCLPPTLMVLPLLSPTTTMFQPTPTSTTDMCQSLMLEFTMLLLPWLPLTPPTLVSASTTRVSKFPAKLLQINTNISRQPVTAEQSNSKHQNCYLH